MLHTSQNSVSYTGGYGDADDLGNQRSAESVASVIFPWRSGLHYRGPPVVAGYQAGRKVGPAGFFLCMASVLLLCSGLGICSAAIWVIIYRVPYIYLTDGSVNMGTNSFGLSGGLLNFPCCWIAWASHDNKRNFTFLPLLMVLLGFSLTMLATGASMGVVYRSHMMFDMNYDPPKLLHNRFQRLLNETMAGTMSTYDTNYNHHWAWTKTQQRLKCCGIYSFKDWIINKKVVPTSCCKMGRCENKNYFKPGCLDIVAYELSWEICLMTGLTFIVILVQMYTLSLASFMYIKEKIKLRNAAEAICLTNFGIANM